MVLRVHLANVSKVSHEKWQYTTHAFLCRAGKRDVACAAIESSSESSGGCAKEPATTMHADSSGRGTMQL